MLKSLKIKNFTVFSDAQIEFLPGLNAIIGDNATGKSHLLKLGYSVMYVLSQDKNSANLSVSVETPKVIVSLEELEQHLQPQAAADLKKFLQQKLAKDSPDDQKILTTAEQLQNQLGDKLQGVFQPDSLDHLCRHNELSQDTKITTTNEVDNVPFSFILNNNQVKTENEHKPLHFPKQKPLFFPTREVLTLLPAFTVLYENRYLSMDETHYDLCKALSLPLLKKLPDDLKEIIKPLETELGGKVMVDKIGRFYLDTPKQGKIEISLIAEGLRKIAMLVYLIMNGSLNKDSTIFWDETEANLNPRIMVKVANALVALVKSGVQVILATHDWFLMKELSLLMESTPEMPARFFSLKHDETGVIVEQGRILEDLSTIVVLDEVLAQDDREQEFYYKSGR